MNLFIDSKDRYSVHNAPEKSHKLLHFCVWASSWPNLALATSAIRKSFM